MPPGNRRWSTGAGNGTDLVQIVFASPIRSMALLFVVCGTALGCSGDVGSGVMNSIEAKHDPRIKSISYSGDDDSSGPLMTVLVNPAITADEAKTLTCVVILPAIHGASLPQNFGLDVLDATGTTLLASETTNCD